MDFARFKPSRIATSLRNRAYQAGCRYVVRRDQAYWHKLKNRYRGQRGWVIGNGPSLKVEDLDRLQGEVSIASNKIYLAFEKTRWRPTLLTVVDRVLWPKIKEDCLRQYPRVHLPHTLFTPRKLFERKLVYWQSLATATCDPKLDCMFSTDVATGMHGGFSVTFENLQLAVHLGLDPIYIIGCDHYYKGESNVTAESEVETKSANHFHPDYRKPGELVTPAYFDGINLAYEHARTFADQNGIQILNATRGGYLDVFERADFDSLF